MSAVHNIDLMYVPIKVYVDNSTGKDCLKALYKNFRGVPMDGQKFILHYEICVNGIWMKTQELWDGYSACPNTNSSPDISERPRFTHSIGSIIPY